MKAVLKVDKTTPGVLARSEVIELELAAAKLQHAGRFETREEAATALLAGEPVETGFCVYQLKA